MPCATRTRWASFLRLCAHLCPCGSVPARVGPWHLLGSVGEQGMEAAWGPGLGRSGPEIEASQAVQ
jgi:hypothetical protein